MSDNRQAYLYDSMYLELYGLLEHFLRLVYRGEDTTVHRQKIISYLLDAYSVSFYAEASEIIAMVDGALTEDKIVEIQNSVDVREFRRANQNRLKQILNDHATEVRYLKKSVEGITEEDVIRLYKSSTERLAISEAQMLVETASVHGAKAVEVLASTKLYKTWNSVLDERTCPTCTAMHGTTVPVGMSFLSAKSGELYEGLDYTGGDIPYAHPRCRCWVTYSTEESPL